MMNGNFDFQIISDVHIERDFPRKIDVSDIICQRSDTLFVAGDIGRIDLYEQYSYFLISLQNSSFKNVYVILGNHEHYSERSKPYEMIDKLRLIIKNLSKVKLLVDEHTDLCEGLRLYGTTLWSSIPVEASERCLPILTDQRSWVGANWVNRAHKNALALLEGAIKKARDDGKELIVMSHYPPVVDAGNKRFAKNRKRFWYINDLPHLLQPHIKAWVFGHTHNNCDTIIRETRLVSNQYRGKGYSKNKVISV